MQHVAMNYKRTPMQLSAPLDGDQNARCQHTPHGTRNVKGGAGTITDAARITRHSKLRQSPGKAPSAT